MESLAERFVDSLAGGEPDRALLATAGEPEPEAAAEAFLAAAREESLAPALRRWVPPLLRSARPGFGAAALHELAAAGRQRGTAPALDGPLPELLGDSAFLARTLQRHPEWADDLATSVPPPPDAAAPALDWSAIRRAKYRGLLRIAARDLAGRPFAESLRELSDLADGCLQAGLACAAEQTGHAAPALLALGKLGGRELNFSSDVDLLFLYSTDGSDEPTQIRNASGVVRVFKTGLEEPSVDGFGYRVDLDLRPEGRTGVLVNSVDAALGFYESFGAEWERQMLIRLRGVAGPEQTIEEFGEGIAPFVYRRSIDPTVMSNVRNMKARIEEERLHAGRDLEANLKEGPGGIRDIEFIVQSLVLFFGGRENSLRTGNVLDALAACERRELLPEDTVASLSHCYLWLRRAEHAVQLPEEQQTAQFPRDPDGQRGLARRMGYREESGADARDALLDDWTSVRTEVRSHFEDLVLSGST